MQFVMHLDDNNRLSISLMGIYCLIASCVDVTFEGVGDGCFAYYSLAFMCF